MAEPDQFIEITDFRPGIYSNIYESRRAPITTSSRVPELVPELGFGPDGAATIENTYDCCADDSGALVPAPIFVSAKTSSPTPGGSTHTGSTYINPTFPDAYLLAAAVFVSDVQPVSLYTIWGAYYAAAGNSSYKIYVIGYRHETVKQETIFADGVSATGAAGIAVTREDGDARVVMMAEIAGSNPRALTADELTITTNRTTQDNGASNTDPRMSDGTTIPPTLQYLARAWSVANTGWGNGWSHITTTTDLAGIPYEGVPMWLVGHQARIVAPAVNSGGTSPGSDGLRYTSPRLPLNGGVQLSGLVAGEEHLSEIGCIGSVTSDQLLIVKRHGGGEVISGDLDFPDIRRLPFIASTEGLRLLGTHTPIGFVYGAASGVHVWTGGDTTEHISPQIKGYFFDHLVHPSSPNGSSPLGRPTSYKGVSGSFGYIGGRVYVPNNFFYDINQHGWWRLSALPNGPFNHYSASDTGLYAFTWRVRSDLTSSTYAALMDSANYTRATSYSWQSHCLTATRGRMLSFQNIELVAEYVDDNSHTSYPSSATITITLKGFSPDTSLVTTSTTVFTIPAGKVGIHLLRKDIAPNFQAEYVQVRIQAEVTNPDLNTDIQAVTIRSLRLGYKDRARIPRVS